MTPFPVLPGEGFYLHGVLPARASCGPLGQASAWQKEAGERRGHPEAFPATGDALRLTKRHQLPREVAGQAPFAPRYGGRGGGSGGAPGPGAAWPRPKPTNSDSKFHAFSNYSKLNPAGASSDYLSLASEKPLLWRVS